MRLARAHAQAQAVAYPVGARTCLCLFQASAPQQSLPVCSAGSGSLHWYASLHETVWYGISAA